MSMLKLIRNPNCQVSGQALFRGQDLIAMRDKEMRSCAGARSR